jgi:DNA-binding SARP family transcriptional activator
MYELRAFGDPHLLGVDGSPVTSITRQTKRFALLIFLACDGLKGPHRREELLSVFWPEADPSLGRNSLRQTLHALRQELGPGFLLGNGSDELWVKESDLRCDVASFTQAIAQGHSERALQEYRADFLLGFEVRGCPEFGAWADQRRTDLKDLAANAARDLAHQSEGARDLAGAVFWWKKTLRLRPFDEAAVRRVMTLLAWMDDRGDAIAEFEYFRGRLVDELGLEPCRATLELREKIATGRIGEVDKWIGDRRKGTSKAARPLWRRSRDLTYG